MTTPELPRNEDGTLAEYAWPGGYQLYYVTGDAGTLCPDCANMAAREGLTNDREDNQWWIVGADINYEDDALYCDHCGDRIPSAYNEPEDNSCDQCCAAMINGTFCHETGCPNTRKVKVDGEWIDPPDEEDSDA